MNDDNTSDDITKEDLLDQLIGEWQEQSTYLYIQPIKNNLTAIMHDKGIIIYEFKWTKIKGNYYEFSQIYRWNAFKILSFYRFGIDDQKQKYFRFLLNSVGDQEFYNQQRKIYMIEIIQRNAIIQSRVKSIIVPLINQMIQDPAQQIEELDIVNFLGFTANGWRMPDKYKMVAHNELRKEIERRIHSMVHRTSWKLPDVFMTQGIAPVARFCMKELYELTGIRNKDPLFAYIVIAPFLYALRDKYYLLPLCSLGGTGGLGKTALFNFATVKIWDHVKGAMGGTVLNTLPRVDAVLSASTLPVNLDDCSKIKPFTTDVLKRYTTVEDTVKKFNRDQTLKMNAPFCTPCYLTYNAYPVLFEDAAFRQRIFNRNVTADDFTKNESWGELEQFIPDGLIGRYIYEFTKEWDLDDLLVRLEQFENHHLLQYLSGRAKDICRLMLLGAELFEELFGVQLDMSSLPADLRESVKAGNEDIVDLIIIMIEERHNFEYSPDKGDHQVNPRHWVQHKVLEKKYKGQLGFLITADNSIDLAKRLGRKPKDLRLPTLNALLQTEFSSVYDTFKINKSNRRGVWIPAIEIIDGKREDEERMKAEIEQSENLDVEFEPTLENEISDC